MANPRAERFMAHLDRVFGRDPEFYPITVREEGAPKLVCLVYRDFPEPGHITGVTYGLSEVPHPDWTTTRSELILSVKSTDVSWPLAMATMAEGLRGRCAFQYGDNIHIGGRISRESEMSAFFVFFPSVLQKSQFLDIDVGPYRVQLAGIYPMYEEERPVLHKAGLESFFAHPALDPFDVNRPRLELAPDPEPA